MIGCGGKGDGRGVGENILGKETPAREAFFFFSKMVLVHLKNKNAFNYVGH